MFSVSACNNEWKPLLMTINLHADSDFVLFISFQNLILVTVLHGNLTLYDVHKFFFRFICLIKSIKPYFFGHKCVTPVTVNMNIKWCHWVTHFLPQIILQHYLLILTIYYHFYSNVYAACIMYFIMRFHYCCNICDWNCQFLFSLSDYNCDKKWWILKISHYFQRCKLLNCLCLFYK